MLAVDAIHEWAEFDGFEAMLRARGPWLAAVDFPFGLPAAFVAAVGWPAPGPEYVARVAQLDRRGFRSLVEAFKVDRPAGGKDLKRAAERRAGAASPLNLTRPPVGLMFFEGAPRLWRSDASIPPLRPRRTNRIVVEAYPALVALWAIGTRRYKDGAPETRPARAALRAETIERIGGDAADAHYGFRTRLGKTPAAVAVADDSGDRLDAALCAVQGAWAWQHRDRSFGAPDDGNRNEGWIVDPAV